MSTLLELADRIEAAKGPDRQLDANVLEIAGWVRKASWLEEYWQHNNGKRFYKSQIPAYTGSVDHALALLPEDWRLELEQFPNSWMATISNAPWFDDRRKIVDADAATIPLALTAASLRALASMGSSG